VSDSFTLGLAVAADGTTWIGTDTGLATVQAGVARVRFLGQFGPIAIGPDGGVYVAGPSGIYRTSS